MNKYYGTLTNLQKYKILIFGIFLLVVGISLLGTSLYLVENMSMCENSNYVSFPPNKIITSQCKVVSDVGQEIALRVQFFSGGGHEILQIPAHLQIIDPNKVVLHDIDFNEKTIISFKPKTLGIYTAIISNLEDENNITHVGNANIHYGFGFLTNYDDVFNPIGNMVVYLIPTSTILFLFGIGIIVFGIIKTVRQKE